MLKNEGFGTAMLIFDQHSDHSLSFGFADIYTLTKIRPPDCPVKNPA